MIDATEAGRRLRAAREATGISQSEAGRRLGVPHARVGEYEAGRKVMAWTRLVWYVETLGLDWRLVLPEATARRGRRA